MKVLIWIGCILLNAILSVACDNSYVLLNVVAKCSLFYLMWYVAKKLCKKWDDTHFKY